MFFIVSQLECERDNKDVGIFVIDVMFCIGYGGFSFISICNIDSGGLIVCKDWIGRWYLQGVVSWGIGGCYLGYYFVNVRVSKYRNWIESYIMGQVCKVLFWLLVLVICFFLRLVVVYMKIFFFFKCLFFMVLSVDFEI